MALQPNVPIVNAPSLYVNGLNLSWPVQAPSHVVYLSFGAARNNTNVNDIVLNEQVIIDANVVGAANGLDTGVFTENVVYAVYVIGDSTGYQSSAGLLSASFVQPNLPFGYDMYRRVGTAPSYLQAASVPSFADMWQQGDGELKQNFYYGSPSALVNGNATVWTEVALNQMAQAVVPPVDHGMAVLSLIFTAAVDGDTPNIVPFRSDFASFPTFVSFANVIAPAALQLSYVVDMPYALNAGVPTVVYNVTNAGDTLTLSVVGFYDYL